MYFFSDNPINNGRFQLCKQKIRLWPLGEQTDPEIQAHLSSAPERTAELALVNVTLAANDPKENWGV